MQNIHMKMCSTHADLTYKGFARGLVLKQRHKVTRKWPSEFVCPKLKQDDFFRQHLTFSRVIFLFVLLLFCQRWRFVP